MEEYRNSELAYCLLGSEFEIISSNPSFDRMLIPVSENHQNQKITEHQKQQKGIKQATKEAWSLLGLFWHRLVVLTALFVQVVADMPQQHTPFAVLYGRRGIQQVQYIGVC